MTSSSATRRSAAIAAAQSTHRRLAAFLDTILSWQDRARERRRLAGLDHRMLKDIGLNRGDVHQEVSKPFWRA